MIGTSRAPRGHNKYSTDAEIRLIRWILYARTEQPRSFNDLRDCRNGEIDEVVPIVLFSHVNDGTGWLAQGKIRRTLPERPYYGLPEE